MGATAVAGNPTGLTSYSGTHGDQAVNFTTALSAGLSTGIILTGGYQKATFNPIVVGANATGLVGATTYTTTITIDGTPHAISILGSTAQTFTTLISALNTQLGAAGSAFIAGDGSISVTSASQGTSTSVLMVTGTLFPALAGFSAITASVPGTGSTSNLTASIVVDGVTKAVSVAPASLATFGAVITALNSALGAAGSASIVGNDIIVLSATAGTSSTVRITDTNFFSSFTGFKEILPAQNGGGKSRSYNFNLVIDDLHHITVATTGTVSNTFTNLLTVINAALGAYGTAAITGGNIVITSATTGITSKVRLDDTGSLANRLTGYVGLSHVDGVAPVMYTFKIIVDGAGFNLSVAGNAIQTYTLLVSYLNTQLSGSATVAIVNGNIIVTSVTTGVTSTVRIDPTSTMLKALSSFVGVYNPIDGIVSLLAAMKAFKNGSDTFYHLFNVKQVGTKPAVPPFTPHTVKFTYFDGTHWKYLDNDALV